MKAVYMLSSRLIAHLSTDIAPAWFDYPIVALAQRQASGSPLGTLERLSELLAHVEDRLPTVDYTTLFDSHHLSGLSACELAHQYRRLGVQDEDLLEELFPDEDVSPDARMTLRREKAQALRGKGLKLREISAELGYTNPASTHYLLNHKPRSKDRLTEDVHRVGTFRLDLGPTDASRLLGVTRQRVWLCRRLVRESSDQ